MTRVSPFSVPAFHYSPAWPIARRLAQTGSSNPNYRHGRAARYRRRRLEGPLQQAMSQLRPVLRRYPALGPDQLALLGWLTGEQHPDRWAFRHRSGGWYVPRAAWAWAAAWLRSARRILRRLFFTPSPMPAAMPPIYQRGSKDEQPRGRRSASDEVRRLREACVARGLVWETGRPTA